MSFKGVFFLLILIIGVTVSVYFLGLLNFLLLTVFIILIAGVTVSAMLLSSIRVSCNLEGENTDILGKVTVKWFLNLFKVILSRTERHDEIKIFLAGLKMFERTENHQQDKADESSKKENQESRLESLSKPEVVSDTRIRTMPEEASAGTSESECKSISEESKEQKPEVIIESQDESLPENSLENTLQASDKVSSEPAQTPADSSDELSPEEELQREYMQELEKPERQVIEGVHETHDKDNEALAHPRQSCRKKTKKGYSFFVSIGLKFFKSVKSALDSFNSFLEKRVFPFKEYYLIIHREILYTLKKLFLLAGRFFKSFSTSGIDLELVWGEVDHPSELGQATALVSFVSGLLSEKIRLFFHPDFQCDRKIYFINGSIDFSVFRVILGILLFAVNPRQILSFYRIYRHIRKFDDYFSKDTERRDKRKAA